MKEPEMKLIAKAILTVLDNIGNAEKISEVREIAKALCHKFPLPY